MELITPKVYKTQVVYKFSLTQLYTLFSKMFISNEDTT